MSGTYDKARADFEYLESFAELVDQVDLDSQREALMRDPTKARAAQMYQSGIRMWLSEHGDAYSDDDDIQRISREYGA